MYINRFQQGDEVQYIGDKTFSDGSGNEFNIRGKMGTIVARVGNSETGVVVDFDGGTYVMDEQRHLVKFVRKAKPSAEFTDQKIPEVQKRRSTSIDESFRKGGKRRKQDDE